MNVILPVGDEGVEGGDVEAGESGLVDDVLETARESAHARKNFRM